MGAWGYGLFQSDHDFDIANSATKPASPKWKKDAQSAAKADGKDENEINRIYYTLLGNSCSDIDLVRKHLESGVLESMVARKEADILALPTKEQELEHYFRDPCYFYVLLGACVMTLGCQIPDSFIAMLKTVYTEGGLMPDALKQMEKALFGPHGFKSGEPYDFDSKDLIEAANSVDRKDDSSKKSGFIGMNVLSPGGLLDTRGLRPSSKNFATNITSPMHAQLVEWARPRLARARACCCAPGVNTGSTARLLARRNTGRSTRSCVSPQACRTSFSKSRSSSDSHARAEKV